MNRRSTQALALAALVVGNLSGCGDSPPTGSADAAAADVATPDGATKPDAAVVPAGAGQGSHVLGGLAGSDALIVVPEDVTEVRAGDSVTVMDLRTP